jgi:Flp pilus assembly protein TadG
MAQDRKTGKSIRLGLKALAFEKEGVAAIEFGIISAVLLILFLCSVDLSLAAYSDMQVQTSAQSGAEYAAVHTFNSSAISSAVTNATSTSGISATPAPSQFCGCPSGSGVATATCLSHCADGAVAGNYVTVSATRTYSTIVTYPGFPTSYTQSTSTTVRVP